MALDPRIALASQAPDLGAVFNNVLSNIGRIDTIRQNRDLAPLQQQEARARQQQALSDAEITRQRNRLESVATFAAEVKPLIDSGDFAGAKQAALNRRASIAKQIEQNPGIQLDTTETDQFLSMLENDPTKAKQSVNQAIQLGEKMGVFGDRQLKSVSQREFEFLNNIVSDPNSPPEMVQAARIKLRTAAPAGTSAEERIALDPELTSRVAESQGEIQESKEAGKSKSQLRFKPQIESAVELARSEAKARGETLTSLKQAEAAMPGLLEAVGQLKELAPIATSTYGGRAFDVAVKETGFGSTSGANAKAKFIAIINNQVLPLLRPTFGAAFTEREGETLKATMGDPNSSPSEKLVQLEAFIEQKKRDIETDQAELGIGSANSMGDRATIIRFDAQGNIIQ